MQSEAMLHTNINHTDTHIIYKVTFSIIPKPHKLLKKLEEDLPACKTKLFIATRKCIQTPLIFVNFLTHSFVLPITVRQNNLYVKH